MIQVDIMFAEIKEILMKKKAKKVIKGHLKKKFFIIQEENGSTRILDHVYLLKN